MLEARFAGAMSIADSLAHVRSTIAAAAAKAGRSPADVTLIAVSKGFGAEAVAEAAAAGQAVFGENRVQEAAAKIPMLSEALKWHMLGHIQSNKAKQAAALFDCIHSVDSVKLANALARHAASQDKRLPILLQVSVSGKESQFGIAPSEVPAVARDIAAHGSLRLDGLMSIASFTENEGQLRAEFGSLRELRAELQELIPDHPCRELSMGMTNDYAIAIEEGATIVRVGRAIFGERPPQGQPELAVATQRT